MIKKYKQFNEGLLDKLTGPSEEDTFNYLLLNKSSEPNKLLSICSEKGFLYGVKKAIEMGANIHYNDDEALGYACDSGNGDLVEYLLKKGADIKWEGDILLQNAAYHGHAKVVKALLEYGADVHSNDEYALRFAAQEGHLDVVEVLLQYGADVHKYNDNLLNKYKQYTDTQELYQLLKKYS